VPERQVPPTSPGGWGRTAEGRGGGRGVAGGPAAVAEDRAVNGRDLGGRDVCRVAGGAEAARTALVSTKKAEVSRPAGAAAHGHRHERAGAQAGAGAAATKGVAGGIASP